VKKINYYINKIFRIKNIVVAFLILCNSILLFPFASGSLSDFEQSNYHQIINQAINSFLESSADKSNFKVLQESNSEKFYSYDNFLKKLSFFPKIFTIISETFSEQNIRYSTFLLTQAQTST
jgi:hypothetical protein